MIALSPQEAARKFTQAKITNGFVPLALHSYQNESGEPLYWRIRLKHPATNAKWIRPMHCNEQGLYVLQEPRFTSGKPLYRLPEILNNHDAVVWITEGEWCADHLAKLGLIATTSGGVDSVAKTDWSPLANRQVVIWPDNDEAGMRYAHEIASQLQSLKCNIKRVDIGKMNLPLKGDCVDWLQSQPAATKADIEALPSCEAEGLEADGELKPKNKSAVSYFKVNDHGVFYNLDEELRRICSKLEVKALVRDKASENWGRLLEFSDADGNLHTWAMPMEMLKGGGEELRGELLRLGLEINTGARIRNLLIEYITTSKPESRARCVTRTGWYNKVFVLPDRTIGKTEEQVIYQSENYLHAYKQAGSLADWQNNIAAPCTGNSRLVLAISCAFAAMLLHPVNAESGGLHFVGESSSGKTTALRVAASVFGGPDYLNRWRATTNGLEALASLRSDTLLVLDELSQVDPKEAGEIAYMLANGSGKARAGKTGSVRARYDWRILFLSAGEIGLAQHMQEAGKKAKAGQTIRLVDVPADAGVGLGVFETLHHFESGTALSKALLDATEKYYGTAALVFLEHVTQPHNLATFPLIIKQCCEQFIKENVPANASGQVYRVAERFALIAVGGELATQFNITGWQPGEAKQAASTCFKAWLEQRGSLGNQERTVIIEQVQAFFEAHGTSRFEDLHVGTMQRIANRVGFKRTQDDKSEYLVLPEMFRRELCAGFDSKLAAQVLIEVGMLNPSCEGKAQTPHRIPGEGVRKCYHFVRTEPK